MFLAFFSIMISSMITGIKLINIGEYWASVKQFAWALIMMAIVWFQYSALKQTWQNRNRIKSLPKANDIKTNLNPLEEDSIEEMEAEFK